MAAGEGVEAREASETSETIEVSSRSGRVDIVAEDRADVVAEGAAVRRDGATIVVEGGSGRLVVRCPAGSNLRVGSASGRVTTRGRLGDVRITTASGSVDVEAARSLDVRTSSGSVSIGECDDCRAAVTSGRLRIGRARHLDASAKSGRVEAGPVDSAEVRVASGNVELAATGAGDVAIATRSGSVTVSLPEGVCPECDVQTTSGRVSCEPALGDDCCVTVRAHSGNVDVRVR